tara:strand:+ start:6266 stop:6421 length:156 start_codon:yes stop_codon:yes gene_type:complete
MEDKENIFVRIILFGMYLWEDIKSLFIFIIIPGVIIIGVYLFFNGKITLEI